MKEAERAELVAEGWEVFRTSDDDGMYTLYGLKGPIDGATCIHGSETAAWDNAIAIHRYGRAQRAEGLREAAKIAASMANGSWAGSASWVRDYLVGAFDKCAEKLEKGGE